jgi:hypothetical protein
MSSHTQQAQAQQAQAQAEPIQQQQQDDDLFVPGIGEPDDLLERIEPPSEAPIWPSLAAAMADLNAFTGPNGWALTSFRTEKKKDEVVRVFLHCDRGGTYRSRVNEDFSHRGTASRQVGCPFDASFATSLLLVVGSCVSATLIIIMVQHPRSRILRCEEQL